MLLRKAQLLEEHTKTQGVHEDELLGLVWYNFGVFVNLLTNTQKAQFRDGELVVRTSPVVIHTHSIEIMLPYLRKLNFRIDRISAVLFMGQLLDRTIVFYPINPC